VPSSRRSPPRRRQAAAPRARPIRQARPACRSLFEETDRRHAVSTRSRTNPISPQLCGRAVPERSVSVDAGACRGARQARCRRRPAIDRVDSRSRGAPTDRRPLCKACALLPARASELVLAHATDRPVVPARCARPRGDSCRSGDRSLLGAQGMTRRARGPTSPVSSLDDRLRQGSITALRRGTAISDSLAVPRARNSSSRRCAPAYAA